MFCDRCVQRAVATLSKVGKEGQALSMALCGHHTRQHHEALTNEGWIIQIEEGSTALLPDTDDAVKEGASKQKMI